VIKKIDFSKFSSIKCGGVIDVFIIQSQDDIPKNHTIIGLANNLLVSPNAKNLMMLSKKFNYITHDDFTITIGGATPSGKIVSYCKKHDIGGFEFLSSLPGSLGGLVKMNAGLGGYEIFDNLLNIKNQYQTLFKKEIAHGYRFSNIEGVIFEAVFTYKKGFSYEIVENLNKLRRNQPKHPSAGSCFKNPPNDYAGRLIEAVGLRGYQKGGFCFSKDHANFLVNLGGGKFEDAIWLIKEAQRRVYDEFNITLEREIVVLF